MFWLIGRLIRLALLLAVAFAAFMAWALWWPQPHDVRDERCPVALSRTPAGCVTASGRVLYHTSFGHGRHAHLVLLSRRSLTLPGVVTMEFPAYLDFEPRGLGFGDWISVYGAPEIGSHHEHDIHVDGVATADVRIHCGVLAGRHICRLADRWPKRV